MKTIVLSVAAISLVLGAQSVMACKIPQPFKVWPASDIGRFMLGYHSYYAPDRIYNETIADDQAFGDGWNTAEKFASIIPTLKETPTSYAEGWMAGYKHKYISV